MEACSLVEALDPMESPVRILVSAAERSGDMHAANLVSEVLRRRPDVEFDGFGGDLLRAAGCRIHEDLVSVASMGVGFFRHLGQYFRTLRIFQRLLAERRPAAVVLVDSPGINFALARLARWGGVPVVYYICPQIWAWAPWRRAKILKYTDLLLVILPFEEDLYRNTRVAVRYVGHPLGDTLARVSDDAGWVLRGRLGIPRGHHVIGLLPGSRAHEVKDLMPLLAGILEWTRADRGTTHIIASCVREGFRGWIEEGLRRSPFPATAVTEDARSVILASDLVIAASGTVTLETAYFQRPMMVLYRAGFLSQLFFRIISTTPYFALPNILGAGVFEGEPVVLERLCRGGEAEDLAPLASALLAPGPTRDDALARLGKLKERIFRPGATARAADALLQLVSRR